MRRGTGRVGSGGVNEHEPPEIVIPPRDWGDDEDAAPVGALILVSSRDGRGDPVEVPARVAAWRGLSKRAEKAGWSVSVTYALAWWPDRHYLNGNLKKGAHHVHSVAIRLARGAERAFAVWSRETLPPDLPLDEWSFSVGFVGLTGFKARAWSAAITS